MTTRYCLITPARNEEATIERTLQSVTSQTVLPCRYIVVSDGSVDRTDVVVQEWAARFPFISLLRASANGVRSFGSKVYAFRAGFRLVEDETFDFIGNLDADVSFGPEYFERLFAAFFADAGLGLAGGIILERLDNITNEFTRQIMSSNSVAGAVQMFRRECYESFGGYQPLPFGGIDSAAEILTRMHGWRVKTIDTLEVLHHRRVGTVGRGIFKARFKKGLINYSLGYHPLFQVLVSVYRMTDRPFVLGGFVMLCGYVWGAIRRVKRPLGKAVIAYVRDEQLKRIVPMAWNKRA